MGDTIGLLAYCPERGQKAGLKKGRYLTSSSVLVQQQRTHLCHS